MFVRRLLFLLFCLDFINAIFSPNNKKELVWQIQWCMNLEGGIPFNLAHLIPACEEPTFYVRGSSNFNFISCNDKHSIKPTIWTSSTGACPQLATIPDGHGGTMGAMGQWDVSKIDNMYGLFKNAESFNADISEWQVQKVVSFRSMFENAKKFNQDLSKWSTRIAKDMASMFRDAWAFNADISGWDVTSITTLSETFLNAEAFNQSLSPWDVRNCITFANIFNGAVSMNDILCGSAWVESSAYAAEMCPEDTNPFCVLNSICSCPPGHFLLNNEAANVAVPRNVKGKCDIPEDYNPWTYNDVRTVANMYIHSHNKNRPYTPLLCQQVCEQGQRNGVAVEARSFSVSDGKQNLTANEPVYQCICSTKVACAIDTNPTYDSNANPLYKVDGFQTYDWTNTVLNECVKCDPGLYQAEFGFVGPTCSKQCPAGTYGDESGAILESLCKNCSAGKWSSVTGITSDEGCNGKCSAGKYSTATGITSDAACNGNCSAGRYSEAIGLFALDQCLGRCPAGTFSSKTGLAAAEQCLGRCSVGQFSDATGLTRDVDCTGRCSAGTYSNEIGLVVDDQCKKCPVGRWSNATGLTAHEECQDCPIGRFSENIGLVSVDQCNACPAGRWSNATGLTDDAECTPCNAGKSSTTEGSASNVCIDCSAGKYTEETGSDKCKFCTQGTSYVNRSVACEVCERGKYQKHGDVLAPICMNCPAGWLNPDNKIAAVNHQTCDPCPQSLPVSGVGAFYCFGCPAGWLKNNDGTAACIACLSGTQGNSEGTLCSNCSAGTYQPNNGTAFCLPCIPGMYSNQPMSIKCQFCQQNKYSNRTLQTVCENCPEGKKSVPGSASCIPCDAGEAGATCEDCVAGKFRAGSDVQAKVCRDCPSGYYQSAEKTTSCNKCPAGYYNNAQDGASECIECKSGFYHKGSFQTSDQFHSTNWPCVKCGMTWEKKQNGNYFPSLIRKTNVDGTPAGEFSEFGGAPKCSTCSEGRFTPDVGSIKCTKCPRGFFQSNIGRINCEQCERGKTTTIEGAATCSGCDLGSYGSSKGTCSKCPAGQYQDGKGESLCKECDVDTYSNEPGKSSKADCKSCSADRSTGTVKGNTNSSACLCKRVDYYKNERNECKRCPPGADCSMKDGVTLSQLISAPGYWRANGSTTVFTDCKVAFSSSLDPEAKAKERCPGGKNSTGTVVATNAFDSNIQCKNIEGIESYGGPSCMSCANKDYTMSNGKCTRCEGGSSMGSLLGAMLGAMLPLYVIFAVVFMKAKTKLDGDEKDIKHVRGCCSGIHKKTKKNNTKKKLKQNQTHEEKIQEHKEKDAVGRLMGDQVMIGKLQGDGSRGGGETAHRDDIQVIIDRVKILYGWMQVFTALTFTYDIPWPGQLREMSLGLNFINLDLGNLLGGSACTFALPYLDTMVASAILPFLLLGTIFISRVPAWFLRIKHRQKQKAVQIKIIITLALILYPGLCTRLFSSLKVVTVQGLKSEGHSGDVLAVDYSVEAFGAHHMPYVYLAIAGMVVFVIGIPVSVFFALRSNKKYLYTTADSSRKHHRKHEDVVDEFGTLYLQYEPKYWYWEVTVILKKMLLTGAMTIIAPGSSAQLVIALLIVLVNMLFLVKLGPYVDSADDSLAFLTNVQMILTLLGGLLLMTDDPNEPTYDSNFMGIALVVINSFAFGALLFGLLALHPAIRKRLNKNDNNDHQNNNQISTKVMPSDSTKKIAGDKTSAINGVTNSYRYADGSLKTAKDYYADQKTTVPIHSTKIRPEEVPKDVPTYVQKEVQKWGEWAEESDTNAVTVNSKQPPTRKVKVKKKTKSLKKKKTTRQELRDIRRDFGNESEEYQVALKNMQ